VTRKRTYIHAAMYTLCVLAMGGMLVMCPFSSGEGQVTFLVPIVNGWDTGKK